MRILIVVTLILAIPAAVFGQAAQPPTSQAQTAPAVRSQTEPTAANAQQVPDDVVYLVYFRHLANLDKIAAQLEAEGKDGNGWRTHEQRAAHLSPEEGDILRQISSDCVQAVAEVTRKAQTLISAVRAEHPNADLLNTTLPFQLSQLQEEETQIVNEHIDRLRSMIDAAAFNKLTLHINKNFKPGVKVISIQPPVAGKPSGGGQ